MSYSEGRLARPRQALVPCISNRTLNHPSFLPLCMAARFRLHNHRVQCQNQTVHPIIPAELFYTDPTMSCRRRIPNIVTNLRIFDCFQFNTPPPIMSACLAPPNRLGPFRSGPHPTRNLGSPIWRMQAHRNRVQSNHFILQLTQKDQAITNHLKVHHQGPSQSSVTLCSAQTDYSGALEPPQNVSSNLFSQRAADGTSAEQAYKPLCRNGDWSEKELEAADILLNCFTPKEDRIQGQNHHKSADTLPGPQPYERHGDASVSAEASPALTTSHSSHSDIGNVGFSAARKEGEPGCRDESPTEDELLSVEVRGRTLTDSELVALHVLLSLGNTGTLDTVQ